VLLLFDFNFGLAAELPPFDVLSNVMAKGVLGVFNRLGLRVPVAPVVDSESVTLISKLPPLTSSQVWKTVPDALTFSQSSWSFQVSVNRLSVLADHARGQTTTSTAPTSATSFRNLGTDSILAIGTAPFCNRRIFWLKILVIVTKH
jgi:hypothetical protein